MNNRIQNFCGLFLFLILQACTPADENSPDATEHNTSGLVAKNISSIKILDASRQILSDADITVSALVTDNLKNKADIIGGILQSDADGNVILPDLSPGTYVLTVSKSNVIAKNAAKSVITFKVGEQNQSESLEIIVPLSQDDAGVWSDLSQASIIATISGFVSDGTVAVVGAEVSLSGGSATNGSIVTSYTDALGHYDLNINLAQSFTAAMLNASLIVNGDGYSSLIQTGVQVEANTVNSGVNIVLVSSLPADIVFRETFETDSNSLSDWSVKKISGDNANNTWNIYNADQLITNQAYTNGLVKLAPNDNSAGQILSPVEGVDAYWYGSAQLADGENINGSVQGNFLGNQAAADINTQDGGISTKDSSSELISPLIDLSNVSADEPLSLTFQHWWEIESVNPNLDGFDLMTVSLSTDSGVTFTPIARLNPLSDPQDSLDRSALPFSNTGYNSAPMWSRQENIPLKAVQGKIIQLKFTFFSSDELYNGFRGWMIDDIQIQKVAGSFPLFESTIFYADNGGDGEIVDGDFAFGYVYGALNDAGVFLPISPAAVEAGSFKKIPLTIDAKQTFTATVSTISTVSGTLHFVLRSVDANDETIYTDTLPFASIDFAKTDNANESENYILSGEITIPNTNNPLIDLYVVMLDANGNLLFDSYLETYGVKSAD